jgi:hypothetical protein
LRFSSFKYKSECTIDINVDDKKIVDLYPELEESIKRVKYNRVINKNPSYINKHNYNYNRLYYIRYLSYFLFGYAGTKKIADEIYVLIQDFMMTRLYIKCRNSKTGVVHSSVYTKYLDTLIRWVPNYGKSVKNYQFLIGGSSFISYNRPSFNLPIKDLFNQLMEDRYVIPRRIDKKLIRPTSFRNLLRYNIGDIVLSFNIIIDKILNYYSFVNRRSNL